MSKESKDADNKEKSAPIPTGWHISRKVRGQGSHPSGAQSMVASKLINSFSVASLLKTKLHPAGVRIRKTSATTNMSPRPGWTGRFSGLHIRLDLSYDFQSHAGIGESPKHLKIVNLVTGFRISSEVMLRTLTLVESKDLLTSGPTASSSNSLRPLHLVPSAPLIIPAI